MKGELFLAQQKLRMKRWEGKVRYQSQGREVQQKYERRGFFSLAGKEEIGEPLSLPPTQLITLPKWLKVDFKIKKSYTYSPALSQ